MNVDYALIGSRIKSKRRDKRMTQEMMAEALDVSVGYVSQVERGVTKISLDLLAEISGLLDCDISFFVSGTATGERGYLKDEFSEKFERLSKKQRRIAVEIIDVLIKEEE